MSDAAHQPPRAFPAAAVRLHPRHAGVDARHGYRAPRIRVPRLDDPRDGDRMGQVLLLTDSYGERCDRDASVRLGWTPEAIHLEVAARAPAVTRPELEPTDPDFWRQDHVEFRVLPAPHIDLEQLQFLLTPSGRYLAPSVTDPASTPDGITLAADRQADGWQLRARIGYSALGLEAPLQPGQVLHGLVAILSWSDGWPRMACSCAAQLGFAQAERFARFELAPALGALRVGRLSLPAGPLPRGRLHAELDLSHHGDSTISTHLRVGDLRVPVELPPGRSRLPVDLDLSRPAYTHVNLALGDLDLGAVTLRAAVPPLRPNLAETLRHPYLIPDPAVLRAKAHSAPFAAWLQDLPPPPAPPPDLAVDLDFAPGDGNWLRVCRESLLPRGHHAARPDCRRIWERLDARGQDAAARIDTSAGKDAEAVTTLLVSLSRLLRDPALYAPGAFARTPLPRATRAALATAPAQLDRLTLQFHNRTLIQCAVACIHEYRADLARQAADRLLPWILDGDPRHIRAATRCLELAEASMILNPHIDLHTGGIAGDLALAYDAFAPHLLAAERPVWRRVLHRFLDLYWETAGQRHWNTTAIPNANPVCNGGGGLLALALLAEEPDLAAESLALARTCIWNFIDYCAGAQGGNTEGAQYWQYGMENFLRFAVALEHVSHSHDGLLDQPGVTKLLAMVRVGLCPDGAMHGVNDTIPMPVGGNLAWFAAGRYGDPLGLWYGDHAMRHYSRRRAEGLPTPYRAPGLDLLLYRPPLPECHDAPPLPQCLVLDDIQYSIIRSAPRWDAALVAGLKGARPPYTHHNQPDEGSVFIHLRGERLVIDPGYYKSRTDLHSVLARYDRLDSPPAGFTARVTGQSHGDRHHLCAELQAARAFFGIARSYRRHLILLGDHSAVVIDDLQLTSPLAEVHRLYWQCGGPVQPIGDLRYRIDGRHARLDLQILRTADTRVTPCATCELDLHDSHWGYHFADCRHFRLEHFVQSSQALGRVVVSVFTDATDGQVPAAALSVALGQRMFIRLPRGETLILQQTPTGWHPDLAARA